MKLEVIMLKKLLLNLILVGSLVPLAGKAMEEESNMHSQKPKQESKQPELTVSNFLIMAASSAILIPPVYYAANFIHELGHKYVGELLTEAKGDLHWDWNKTPYVAFPSAAFKTPFSKLLMCIAGPAAGIASAYSLKKIADKYFKNNITISSILYTVALVTSGAQAITLIPRTDEFGSSDGYKIVQNIKELLSKKQ